jgi:sugar phosphate isomerase/epimerase
VIHVHRHADAIAQRLARQMQRASGRIAAFHACDWLVPTTDLVFDRGMPGDGVIDIATIRAMAEAAGYAGFTEVELLSRRWWADEPDHVLSVIKERHAKIV